MISIECMTSGWWRIEAVNYAGSKFLMPLAKRGAFFNVSFGDRGVAGSLAIKTDQLVKFRAYCANRGVTVCG
jgi:hypothetical protein